LSVYTLLLVSMTHSRRPMSYLLRRAVDLCTCQQTTFVKAS
jgi:hypothetical protein